MRSFLPFRMAFSASFRIFATAPWLVAGISLCDWEGLERTPRSFSCNVTSFRNYCGEIMTIFVYFFSISGICFYLCIWKMCIPLYSLGIIRCLQPRGMCIFFPNVATAFLVVHILSKTPLFKIFSNCRLNFFYIFFVGNGGFANFSSKRQVVNSIASCTF